MVTLVVCTDEIITTSLFCSKELTRYDTVSFTERLSYYGLIL